MTVKTDDLSDTENVVSLKGPYVLPRQWYVCACVLHLMLYVYSGGLRQALDMDKHC